MWEKELSHLPSFLRQMIWIHQHLVVCEHVSMRMRKEDHNVFKFHLI